MPPKFTRAETRHAKQLFLYGNGDGKPIRVVSKLHEITGVHEETIRRHLPAWEKEAEELLRNTSPYVLAMQLSEETLKADESDRAFVRDQMNSLKWEIENLDELTAKLEEVLDFFVRNFEDDAESLTKASQVFNVWLRGAGQKCTLRSQFVALKKLWDEKSGIDAARDVAVTSSKEMAKGQAKLQLKELSNAPAAGSTERIVGGIFNRPALTDKGKPAESDD